MKRVPIFACLMGLHAALAAAALLWALHVRFGDPLTAALCPAQGSPWEQGKAAFFPLLAAAPVIFDRAASEMLISPFSVCSLIMEDTPFSLVDKM